MAGSGFLITQEGLQAIRLFLEVSILHTLNLIIKGAIGAVILFVASMLMWLFDVHGWSVMMYLALSMVFYALYQAAFGVD